MSDDVIHFPSEKCVSDGGLVCPMDPSKPSESRFVHQSQIASIGHVCKIKITITYLTSVYLSTKFSLAKLTKVI